MTRRRALDPSKPLPLDAHWLTVHEIADYMRISVMTVYRAIEVGDLPATKFGARNFRIARSDFDEYMRKAQS